MPRRIGRPTPLLLALLLLAAGCAPREQRAQLYAMSTLVEVSLVGRSAAQAAGDVAAVERELRRVERTFRAWDEGELADANRALETSGRARIAPDLAAALADAQRLAALSEGRFEPGLGRLVELWGFHAEERPTAPPPPAARISDALSTDPRIARVAIGPTSLAAAPAAPWLDLGGYAKGLAVDRAIAALRSRGVTAALVNAGGDVRAIGHRDGARGRRPWRVGLRDPRGAGVLARLEVAGDACVFTSGDYERAFVHVGTRYHHILDPRTGAPARGAAAVTVLLEHRACAGADAAAIAVMIAGPAALEAMVGRFGLTGAVAVTEDGTLHATAALRARLAPMVDGLRVIAP
jgi:thiamine biosynthesis lipoprotein